MSLLHNSHMIVKKIYIYNLVLRLVSFSLPQLVSLLFGTISDNIINRDSKSFLRDSKNDSVFAA